MEYTVINSVATLTFDDGKANAVGPQFLDDIKTGLDRAQAEQVGAVILRGREGIFSGGFDLEEFKDDAGNPPDFWTPYDRHNRQVNQRTRHCSSATTS